MHKETCSNQADFPITERDAMRLVLELWEELGETMETAGKAEVMRRLRKVMQAGIKTVKSEESTVTLRVAAWASVEARKERRKTTLRDLRYFVNKLLKVDGMAERPLRSINSKECRELLRMAFPNSKHSYCKGRTILHSIFAYGQRQEWCEHNPVSKIEVPKILEKEIIPLSQPQIDKLEAVAAKPEHADMQLPLQLMLYCGIRPAEVCRLLPNDINWEEQEIIIRSRCSKTGGGRIIPLRCITKPRVKHSSVAPRNWIHKWKALRQAAGFDTWQPDVLRHTFASYHAAHFRNIHQLQLEMGHRDVTLLRTRYVVPVSRKEAAAFWKR